MNKPPPKIMVYVNLLHRHGGPESRQAKQFLESNKDDAALQRRAATFNRLFTSLVEKWEEIKRNEIKEPSGDT